MLLTFSVVLYINGIVIVSYKNVVFVEFEVIDPGIISDVKFETPETFRDVRIPVLVMFGCAGVTRDPVSDVRLEMPVTLREVRIPVLVMLPCAAVVRDPEMVVPAIAFAPSTAPLKIPTKRVAVTALVTPSDVRVPTDVILPCAEVVRDPEMVVPAIAFAPSTAPLRIPTKRVPVMVVPDIVFEPSTAPL